MNTKKLMPKLLLVIVMVTILMTGTHQNLYAGSNGQQVKVILVGQCGTSWDNYASPYKRVVVMGTNQNGAYVVWDSGAPKKTCTFYTTNWWWMGRVRILVQGYNASNKLVWSFENNSCVAPKNQRLSNWTNCSVATR